MSTLHVVLAPTAFKGTLTAREAADAMAAGISSLPGVSVRAIPLADGGDGSLDAFTSVGYEPRTASVRDSSGQRHEAAFAMRGAHAVIELARVCGIALPGAHPLRPLDATTLGVGDAVLAALGAGATRISLCLGGSASTDGGMGMLVALGARPLDDGGHALEPTGRFLGDVATLDLTPLDARLRDCTIEVLADVTTPLHGPEGAAHVFAPQKGATPDQVLGLDDGLANWGRILSAECGRDITSVPGTGAAGGTAAAAVAILGATLRPGSATIAELVGLPDALAEADLVIVGEGRLDDQTAQGKAMSCAVDLARHEKVPVIAICGQITLDDASLHDMGLAAWAPAPGKDAYAAVTEATKAAVSAWLAGGVRRLAP
jgi:glycerate 2-kinase